MLTTQDRVHSVQQILRAMFGVVPIVAGADKFFNLLTNWEQYLNPALERLLPFSTTTFMHIAGVVEIVAGLIVLSRFTTFGGYLVSAWLALIAISLLASGHYLDVAVRDLVMSASAYSLAILSRVRQEQGSTNYNQATGRTITA